LKQKILNLEKIGDSTTPRCARPPGTDEKSAVRKPRIQAIFWQGRNFILLI
jgi:hypothetical protein